MDKFRQNITDLRAYLQVISCIQKFASDVTLRDHSSPLGSCIASIKGRALESLPFRMRIYVSAIMGLSTAFEVFIDSLVQEYLRSIMDIFPSYGDLPDRIKSNHRRLTVDLIAKFEQSRFKEQIQIEEIFRRYHQCVSGGEPYEINEEAFLYRPANFKAEKLSEFLHRALEPNIFDGLMARKRIADFLAEHSLAKKEFGILDDLVERRNEVAHGEPTDILSDELIFVYISYLEILCQEIHDEVRSRYLEKLCSVHGSFVGHPDRFFTENLIGIRNKKIPIEVGDFLVSRNRHGFYRDSRVLELQRDGISIKKSEYFDSVGLGVRFSHQTKETHEFFIVSAPKASAILQEEIFPLDGKSDQVMLDNFGDPDTDPNADLRDVGLES